MLRVFRALVVCGVLAGVLCSYVAACRAPAIKVDEGGHACTSIRLGTINGSQALLLGWVPPLIIPWSANVLLVGGVIALLRQRYRMANRCGWSAVLAGLTTPLFVGGIEELFVGYYSGKPVCCCWPLGRSSCMSCSARRRLRPNGPIGRRFTQDIRTAPRSPIPSRNCSLRPWWTKLRERPPADRQNTEQSRTRYV